MIPVTILMAVHNGEAYVEESIASIRNQSFSEFEFLIVDDASDDATADILATLRVEDERIRILRNAENLGLTRSLNRGLRAAKGRYLARLDADDVAHPERLQASLDYFHENQECRLLCTSATLIDTEGGTIDSQQEFFSPSALCIALWFRNPIIHSSVIFDREFALRLGGYDESFRYAQDYELWLRFLAADVPPHMLAEPLVARRVHDSMVSLQHKENQILCHLAAQKKWIGAALEVRASERTLRLMKHPYDAEASSGTDFWRILLLSQSLSRSIRKRFGDDEPTRSQVRLEAERYVVPIVKARADAARHWHPSPYFLEFAVGGPLHSFVSMHTKSMYRKYRGRMLSLFQRLRQRS